VTYSLVSAATLGFDLVRLPAGRQVASVLLTGLAAGPAELSGLAAAHPRHTASPAERAALAGRGRRAREVAASAVPSLSAVSGGTGGTGDTAVLLAQLELGMIGSAAALERLVRRDVLDPAATPGLPEDVRGQAGDVLCDAALAAYAAAALPSDVRRELSAPFAAATELAPPPAHDLGPSAPGLRALLAAVRDLDAAGRARWRAVVDAVRAQRRPWAAAMHEASWAAHVSGRVTAVAAAHLLAVQAFDDAGLDAADGAQGVWNALAGCVQGLALADLLEEGALEVLLQPWGLVTGRSLLPG
jgi:hypothetical protein